MSQFSAVNYNKVETRFGGLILELQKPKKMIANGRLVICLLINS